MLLLSVPEAERADWAEALAAACGPGVAIGTDPTTADPAAVRYIAFAPDGPVHDFSAFPRLCAVFSLWAGVERVVGNPTLTVPLTRMVDPGLTEGMLDYVTAEVLRHHIGLEGHRTAQAAGLWRAGAVPPLARERSVAVLGLGALGGTVAGRLASLGFRTLGWSRRPRSVPGVETEAGAGRLDAVLARAEILVTLLPATPGTESLLDAARLARLPRGAALINPGRGSLVDEAALLAALDSGQIGHATLDVFRQEPLPAAHPFWRHPRVTITPHVAAATRPATAAPVVAENLRRAEAGEPLLHPVDRAAGY